MVHACVHGVAQHCNRGVAVFRRPEYVRPGELHGTISHPPYRAVAKGEAACLINRVHGIVSFLLKLGHGDYGDNPA
jgi:hypothetical protein